MALNGATLSASLINSFAPTVGSFTIINNDGVDAVSGTFAGLAEGATFAIGSQNYRISYVGGTGNDVTLSVTNGPVINTEHFTISSTGNNSPTTVSGLLVADVNATEVLTLSATTAEHASGSTITPSSESGALSAINTAIGSLVYNPGSQPPLTDMITFTVSGASGTNTVNFIFNQAGSGPGITLTGTSGKDVIFGTDQNDTLTGGGGKDQFVFSDTSSGSVQHLITDFETPLDRIDLREFSAVHTLADITVAQQASDTLITVDGNDTILLQNVLAAQVQASNFLFHA